MSYTIIDNKLRDDENLTTQEFAALVTLISYYNVDKGYAYPSYEDLKRGSKIKKDETLINAIKGLVNKGYIKKEYIRGIGVKYFLCNIYEKEVIPKTEYLQNKSTSENGVAPTPNMEDDLPQKRSTTNTNTITKKRTNIYTVEFEEFYSIYPRPVNKEQTFKNWRRTLKKDSKENIIKATKNYIRYIEVNNIDKQYIFKSTNFIGEHQEYKEFIDYIEDDEIPKEKPYWANVDG